MISLTCSTCSHNWDVKDEWAGKRQRCPNCYRLLKIPEADVKVAASADILADLASTSADTQDEVTLALRQRSGAGGSDNPGRSRSRSFSRLRLAELRQNFETALQAHKNPRIEEHLGDLGESDRATLLGELLKQELAYRSRNGETARPEEYWLRFPEHVKLISSFFPKMSSSGIQRGLSAIKLERQKTMRPDESASQPARQEPGPGTNGTGKPEKARDRRTPVVKNNPNESATTAVNDSRQQRESTSRLGQREAAPARHRHPLVNALMTIGTFILLAGPTGVFYYANVRVRASEAEARRAAEQLSERESGARRAEEKLAEVLESARRADMRVAEASQEIDRVRRQLYAVQIHMAQRAWEDSDLPRALELLDTQRPEHAGGTDTRGFEWYCLWRLCHGTRIVCKDHAGPIAAVAGSPDSKRFASAGHDQTVKIWDAATGQPILALKADVGRVSSLTFSPDGKLLALASPDKTIKVWDTATAGITLVLKGHTDTVHGIAFSPDGKSLASASGDQTVKVWDTASGKELFTLKGHVGWVNSVAFSPDGKLLASAGCDKTVKLWDLTSTREIRSFKGHGGSVMCVAFNPEGKQLASGGGAWDSRSKRYVSGELKVWDVASGRETLSRRGLGNWVNSVAISPDGKRLASASGDPDNTSKPGEVRIWDAASGHEMLALRKHTAFVTGVAFSSDGAQLATTGYDRTLQIWNARPVK